MAIYVMSDVHGNYDAFIEMLAEIRFSQNDTLYVLGDVIDRGDCSSKILQHIMYADNIVLLMGNHERMMLDAMNETNAKRVEAAFAWEWNGGYNTQRDFAKLTKEMRQKLIAMISDLPLYEIVEIGGQKLFLSHAALIVEKGDSFDTALDKNIKNRRILWNRDALLENKNKTEYIFIHGHTPTGKWTNDGKYRIFHYDNGRKINIDCGCGRDKRLGCLRIEDMQEFYVDC